MKKVLFMIALLFSSAALANDHDQPMHPGQGHGHGNEHSGHPGTLPTGQLSYGGTGCPAGTMRVAFSPDFLSFSVLFDQFVVSSDGAKGKPNVGDCDAVIPITIPAGMRMQITSVDLRGFAAVPQQGHGQLRSIFNFEGAHGAGDRIVLHFDFQGPEADDYLVTSDNMRTNGDIPATESSSCGGQANLRMSTELRIQSHANNPASLTLDSVDGSTHATYYVNWVPCTADAPADRGNGHGNGRGNGVGRGQVGREARDFSL
jgi:hypothetical protein